MCREVARQTQNTFDADGPPIILVPGVMGTRLENANGGFLWDPDDTPGTLGCARLHAVERGRLLSVRANPGVRVMTRWSRAAQEFVDAGFLTSAHADRGWAGPSYKFYGRGLVDLQGRADRYRGRVYAFGYDWRKSNLDTGRALARLIRDVKAQNDNKAVLVVTHSMGGLVTRAACCPRVGGAESDVLGVVHTLQPAHGTPLAYRLAMLGTSSGTPWFPTHGIANFVADHVLATIQGRTRELYAVISHGARGPFELLPNQWLKGTTGAELGLPPGDHSSSPDWGNWELDDALRSRLAHARHVYHYYMEESGQVGIAPREWQDFNPWPIDDGYLMNVDGSDICESILDGINSGIRYHVNSTQGVHDYVHPNTVAIAGTGCEGDVGFTMTQGRVYGVNYSFERTTATDATVALSSATALRLRDFGGVSAAARQLGISGVEHAAAFGESQPFRDLVWRGCQLVGSAAARA